MQALNKYIPVKSLLCAASLLCAICPVARASSLTSPSVGQSSSSSNGPSQIGSPGAAIQADGAETAPQGNPHSPLQYMVPNQSTFNKPPGEVPVAPEVTKKADSAEAGNYDLPQNNNIGSTGSAAHSH